MYEISLFIVVNFFYKLLPFFRNTPEIETTSWTVMFWFNSMNCNVLVLIVASVNFSVDTVSCFINLTLITYVFLFSLGSYKLGRLMWQMPVAFSSRDVPPAYAFVFFLSAFLFTLMFLVRTFHFIVRINIYL